MFQSDTWKGRLKLRLQAVGLAQEELAEKLGCTRGAVGHYLSGRRSPSLQRVEAIARILRVHPAWLLYGTGEVEMREPVPDPYWLRASDSDLSRREWNVSAEWGEHCYAMQATKGNYAPRLRKGEFAIFDPSRKALPQDEVLVAFTGVAPCLHVLHRLGKRWVSLDSFGTDRSMRMIRRCTELEFLHPLVAVWRPRSKTSLPPSKAGRALSPRAQPRKASARKKKNK